jgi:hypothetical protein
MLVFFILRGTRLMIVAYMLEMCLFLLLRHWCVFFIKYLRKPQYQLNVQFLDLIKLLIKKMTSHSSSISQKICLVGVIHYHRTLYFYEQFICLM